MTTTDLPAFLRRPGGTRRTRWLEPWDDDGLGHVEHAGLSTWWVAERGDLAGWGLQGYYARRSGDGGWHACISPHTGRLLCVYEPERLG